jgi:methyltransferase family protein
MFAMTELTLFQQQVIKTLGSKPIIPDWPGRSISLALLSWVFEGGGRDLVQRTGIWCEFGVFNCHTFNYVAAQRGEAKAYGFDSFEGLPETWDVAYKKGEFALLTPPPKPEGAEDFVIGKFEDTLPLFEPADPVMFCHVDCDIYSSACTVLNWLKRYVVPGSIIVFDELTTGPLENGEMRALFETWGDMKYEWLASGIFQPGNKARAAALIVK